MHPVDISMHINEMWQVKVFVIREKCAYTEFLTRWVGINTLKLSNVVNTYFVMGNYLNIKCCLNSFYAQH